MKKRVFLIALMVLICSMLLAILATTASAEEPTITVRYCNFNDSTKSVITPNADGTYTLRENKYSGNGSLTMADGTVVAKEFYGWISKEGVLYEPGATVSFTKDTDLFEAYGVEVFNEDDLLAVLNSSKTSPYIKLGADMTLTSAIKSEWETTIVDLNGHNITITTDSYALHFYRASLWVVGEGKLTHAPATVSTSNDVGFAYIEYSGFGSGENPQIYVIGKDVTVETPYYLARVYQAIENGPQMHLSGKITAKGIIRATTPLSNASVMVYPNADVTFTGTEMFSFSNKNSSNHYATATFAGSVKLTDSNAKILDDFVLSEQVTINVVRGSKFVISEDEAVRFRWVLPDTMILVPTQNADGTTTYMADESNCTHNWQYDKDLSIVPVPYKMGTEVHKCLGCGITRSKVAQYKLNEVKINISVNIDGKIETYTVSTGDVLNLKVVIDGDTVKTTLTGLKDTESFTASQIIAIDIPAGISSITDFTNSTLETINILDGVNMEFKNISKMTGLKTINIGAATVSFGGLVSSYIETISSKVAGANLTFAENCFCNYGSKKGNLNVQNLELSSGSTYTFGKYAFARTSLKEVIFPDYSTVTVAQKSFAETQTIKYVYVGINSIASGRLGGDSDGESSVFGGNGYLEKVVLMDGVNYVGKWVFSTKAANATGDNATIRTFSDCVFYIHSKTITFHVEAFNDRANGDYTTYLYCANPNITSITSTCNYVIYSGIGHAYTEGVIRESNCTVNGATGYITDCPCSIDYRNNSYKTIVKKTGATTDCEPFGTAEKPLPLVDKHAIGTTVADVIYDNYFENGTIYYFCKDCGIAQIAEEAPSAEPMMYSAGYSVFEADSLGGICYSVKINHTAVEFYEINTGKEFAYGLVVSTHNDGAPVIGKDEPQAGAVMADMTKTDFIMLQIKLSGIKTENVASEINVCAYAIQDDKIRYLSDKKTYDKAEALTYASIKALTQN